VNVETAKYDRIDMLGINLGINREGEKEYKAKIENGDIITTKDKLIVSMLLSRRLRSTRVLRIWDLETGSMIF
jgi:hypothetical protein